MDIQWLNQLSEGFFVVAKVLLEIGATFALAGLVFSLLSIVLTWRPAGMQRRRVAEHRFALLEKLQLEEAPAIEAPAAKAAVAKSSAAKMPSRSSADAVGIG